MSKMFLTTATSVINNHEELLQGQAEAVLNAAITGAPRNKPFSVKVFGTEEGETFHVEVAEGRVFLSESMMSVAQEALTRARFVIVPVEGKGLNEEFSFILPPH